VVYVFVCNRVFIPDENLVWCPEKLLTAVLAHAHYLPDSWRGQAHTNRVREEFSQLFHYKAVSTAEFYPLSTNVVSRMWSTALSKEVCHITVMLQCLCFDCASILPSHFVLLIYCSVVCLDQIVDLIHSYLLRKVRKQDCRCDSRELLPCK
jgi:hypothetical protein